MSCKMAAHRGELVYCFDILFVILELLRNEVDNFAFFFHRQASSDSYIGSGDFHSTCCRRLA